MADSEAEEKLNIAKRFILSAPPGEVNEVIADIKVLVGSNPSVDECLPAIMREYNLANLSVIKSSSGDKVLICLDGENKDQSYVDYPSGRAFVVDHLKSEITSHSNIEDVNSSVEPFRSSTQDAIAKYVRSALSDGYGAVHGFESSDGDITIAINLSGMKLNPRNFWNGRWTSSWKVSFAPSAKSATLSGSTRIVVHYYEDGNVQLETKRQHSIPVQWADAASFGAAITKAVQSGEQECTDWVNRTYKSLSDTAFKALRRKIPRTQTKFQWDKVAAYSLGKELASK